MNACLVELVRLLAVTAQLQIVTAQDRNNSVLFEQAPTGQAEQWAVLIIQRHGNQARPSMAAPRQWHIRPSKAVPLADRHLQTKHLSKSRRGAVF